MYWVRYKLDCSPISLYRQVPLISLKFLHVCSPLSARGLQLICSDAGAFRNHCPCAFVDIPVSGHSTIILLSGNKWSISLLSGSLWLHRRSLQTSPGCASQYFKGSRFKLYVVLATMQKAIAKLLFTLKAWLSKLLPYPFWADNSMQSLTSQWHVLFKNLLHFSANFIIVASCLLETYESVQLSKDVQCLNCSENSSCTFETGFSHYYFLMLCKCLFWIYFKRRLSSLLLTLYHV